MCVAVKYKRPSSAIDSRFVRTLGRKIIDMKSAAAFNEQKFPVMGALLFVYFVKRTLVFPKFFFFVKRTLVFLKFRNYIKCTLNFAA